MRAGLMMFLAVSTAFAQQPAKWRLVEEWRVGGEVEGPHSLVDIRGMGVLPTGQIVIVDAKDQLVHFLDAKGQPVRTVGRKGAGPGEYQQANGLAVSQKGEVIVNDASNNRFTLLSSSGDLLKTIPITNIWGYGYLWDAYYNATGLLDEYVSIRKPGEVSSIQARRVWSADFSKIDTILPAECPAQAAPALEEMVYSFRSARGGMTMSVPYLQPRMPLARSADGATWIGRYPDYGTIVHTPFGKCEPDFTIRLRGQRVRIRSTTRDSSVAEVTRNAARYGAPTPDLGKIPREYPYYDALRIDAAKRLWVERRTESDGRRFEVYTSTGRLVAEVESPVTFMGYRPLIIANDRVLGFVADADDILHLASFRIVR